MEKSGRFFHFTTADRQGQLCCSLMVLIYLGDKTGLRGYIVGVAYPLPSDYNSINH